jgi:DNA polymerase I - 3''-5'' exonuclease and polymerase domains
MIGVAWLSGELKVLETVLKGECAYSLAASEIFNIPLSEVTPAQRQVGKILILSMGYRGGHYGFLLRWRFLMLLIWKA